MQGLKEFKQLLEIMRKLRSPDGGCPWDREQTHHSLINYLREESFEVIEAILADDHEHLCEELGDLILQVVFHALVAEDNNSFNMKDVLDAINEKLIIRHPHVFKENFIQEHSLEDQWELIKNANKKKKQLSSCVFEKIPDKLDPWLASERIQLMAAKEKFDWENSLQVLEKIEEECQELKEAIKEKKRDKVKEELSDLLFSVANLARFECFDMKDLVVTSNNKFKNRYSKMKDLAKEKFPDIKFKKIPIGEKEKLWQMAKKY